MRLYPHRTRLWYTHAMNQMHRDFLASPAWAQMLEDELAPWLDGIGDLGDDVLEVGPGPGLVTDLLRARVSQVTAVELDPDLASALATRLAGTGVQVIHGDAARTDLPGDRFSAAVCCSMLHHVPTSSAQDDVLRELGRVVRPGGRLVLVDSRDEPPIRAFHEDDTFMPLPEETIIARTEVAGFVDADLVIDEFELRLHAVKR